MQAWCRFARAALGQASGACGALAHGLELVAGRAVGGRGLATTSLRWTGPLGLQGAWPHPQPRLPMMGPMAALAASPLAAAAAADTPLAGAAAWSSSIGSVRWCQKGQLSRQRVFKGAGFNDVIMPNTTQLEYGLYGVRALSGKRVAANTIEAVRRTLRRKIKKTARLWIRMTATVPVTRKPLGLRMGKGKGAIEFYATPVRPGQIIFEMDRVPRKVAVQAMQAVQHKFPVKLAFVEWS
ncbi:50S ribosomal protein L16 [Tetrabaena socialis]|uniref:50S ribosomal protein L16 n=1 Tax=Tetrabaena socialis TaxID=47790 RepID=A0A2J8AEJ3_9CHLO|nr:50S ribosomal protein L16 [Tetrabaena socialis]|eukprot:PNH10938.1 50S ribosomal protein L16 [Tetrabaena socialis]